MVKGPDHLFGGGIDFDEQWLSRSCVAITNHIVAVGKYFQSRDPGQPDLRRDAGGRIAVAGSPQEAASDRGSGRPGGQCMTPACEARLDAGLAELGLEVDATARERLLALLALLHKWNRAYNLTAVRDPEQMVMRHLLDSASVATATTQTPGCRARDRVTCTTS